MKPLELVLLILTGVSLAIVFLSELLRKKDRSRLSRVLWILALLLNTALLIARTALSGHLPFANIFESLVFFAWTLELVAIAFNLRFEETSRLLGILLSGMTIVVLLIALTRSSRAAIPRPLMPALMSPWFGIHVLTNFVAYALFTVAFFAALPNLLRRTSNEVWQAVLDQANLFGFFFLALGISTGAAWAYQAWGTYWAWDPKETWTLVTWMVFGLALHARYQRRLGLERILTIFGYLCLWFTYMGVTYILPGLHSYR